MRKATIALSAICAVLSLGVFGPATTPVGAVTGESGVALLGQVPALREEVPSWVPIMWINEGLADAEQFWITDVDSQDLDVAFPAYEDDPDRPYLPPPGTYSSLFNDDVLARSEMDFTALRLTVTGPDPVLQVRVSYVGATGERDSQDLFIAVPIDDGSFSGSAVELATDALGPVQRGSIAWLDLHLTANTSVSDVRLEVRSDAIGIVYPSDALSSGLNNGSTLLEGDSDFGAVRFDTTGLEPGQYSVEVTATYKIGSRVQSVTVQRVVIVQD